SLVLLQDADNLIFAETASLHRLSPSSENRLTSNCGLFRGARHPLSVIACNHLPAMVDFETRQLNLNKAGV
ncbi:hypothetical protein, partial [Thalassovita sp.]|uniref:hypothetical protein n=1 Tax=Thalassovita sp. TaxID=1979401 RepID=UPI002B279218